MSFIPIAVAFVIAFIAGVATSHGPGSSIGAILLGATLSASTTGLLASVLQFLPARYFVAAFALAAAAVAAIVSAALRATEAVGLGHAHPATFLVWAVAAFSALMVSRSTGMRLPALRWRRGRTRAGF